MKKKDIFSMVVLAIFILGGLSGCSDTTVNIYETNIHESAQDTTSSQATSFLGYYYPILSKSPSHWSSLPVDQDGIVMVDYGGQIGKQYNPVTISQYALANYNVYLETGDDSYKKEFIKQADWLLEHQVITGKGFSVWYYNFDWDPERYNCKAPWVSAMSQGQAISVLVRAYQLTGDQSYLNTAERTLGSFEYGVEDGGVRFVDVDGSVFYLECASKTHGRILNGFVFSLLGLYDYYKPTESLRALNLFNSGIETLKARLKDYDTGDWTMYDLVGTRAPESYHQLHCRLLYELYFVTGDPFFLDYAEKWYSYLD